jgi:hypothetical protein
MRDEIDLMMDGRFDDGFIESKWLPYLGGKKNLRCSIFVSLSDDQLLHGLFLSDEWANMIWNECEHVHWKLDEKKSTKVCM